MTERLDYRSVSPAGMEALAGVGKYVAHSGLRKALIDLVYLRVSQINGCAFCIDEHSGDLLKEGFTIEKLVLVPVWRETGDLFSDRERAALLWSESLTKVSETKAPESDFEAAKKVFSEKELADLTIAIGLMNAYNRLGIGFRTTPTSLMPAK